MKYTQQSRAGKARENEDRLMVKELSPDTLLAVMADGMGGLDHGEIAAEISINEIVNCFNTIDKNCEKTFYYALEKADNAIASVSARVGMKMGCAIAIVLIDNGVLYCVSLGNIRILCNDMILTEDNVYVDTAGGTYLTKSLRGRGINSDFDITHHPLRQGWHVRICTDGFYNNDDSDDASVIDITE